MSICLLQTVLYEQEVSDNVAVEKLEGSIWTDVLNFTNFKCTNLGRKVTEYNLEAMQL